MDLCFRRFFSQCRFFNICFFFYSFCGLFSNVCVCVLCIAALCAPNELEIAENISFDCATVKRHSYECLFYATME